MKNRNVPDDKRVRIAGSFDMGWFKRGTGISYNSFSGTGAFMGLHSKKVICLVVLKRKCRMYDASHSRDIHDCKLNYDRSAKGMESRAAILLTKENPILPACNLEIGVTILDNDSNSICQIRDISKHEIIKLADKNHTSKGLVSALYKIKK